MICTKDYDTELTLKNGKTVKINSVTREAVSGKKYCKVDLTRGKIARGLCWCCGNPRLKVSTKIGILEVCIEDDVNKSKSNPCKYYNEGYCISNGKKDGNCKGKLKSSKRLRVKI